MNLPAAVPEVVDETELAAIEAKVGDEVNALVVEARAFVIRTPEDANEAATRRNDVAGRESAILTWFDEPTSVLHKAWKAMTTRRAKAVERYAEPKAIWNEKLRDWNTEQERLRREAEQAAEKERLRLMEEDRLRRAEEAEAAGDDDLAEAIVDGRAPVPVPHVPIAAPVPQKVAGVSFVKKWKAEVVDMGALIKAVAAQPELRPLLAVNQVALNRMASALGDALNIPGVRVSQVSDVRGTPSRR